MSHILNGRRVVRRPSTVKGEIGTIFIPLPRELWTPTGMGKCYCPTCKGEVEAYWDTLAIGASTLEPKQADTAWTVHAPNLHPERVR